MVPPPLPNALSSAFGNSAGTASLFPSLSTPWWPNEAASERHARTRLHDHRDVGLARHLSLGDRSGFQLIDFVAATLPDRDGSSDVFARSAPRPRPNGARY